MTNENEDVKLDISLESIEKCRNIHDQIINYGVSEKEKIKLISLMSFELEDIFLMKKIQESIKNQKNEQDTKTDTVKKQLIL